MTNILLFMILVLVFIGWGISQIANELCKLRKCHENAAYQNMVVSEELLRLHQERKP